MKYDLVEENISRLITEGFINEERFAKSYSRGKFRQNKWGKIKIQMGLNQLGLTEYCIKKGLAEIDSEEYKDQLLALAKKKFHGVNSENILLKRKKTQVFLASKGYEFDLIDEVLAKLVADS